MRGTAIGAVDDMPFVDDVLAPAAEMLRRLKRAMRGQVQALGTLLRELRALLAVEERWLLPELARSIHGGAHSGWLAAVGDRLHRMEDSVACLLRIGPSAPEAPAIVASLQDLLARHLREQRTLLAAALDAGLIRPGERLARFTRRAWHAVRGGGVAAAA